MRRPIFCIALVFLAVLLCGSFSAFADGLVVHNGATLTLNEMTLDLNCLDLTVESGGTFNLASGTVTECGNLIVAGGGSLIQGAGTIDYCEETLPPTATTQAATVIGTTSATLNGLANANGTDTTVTFEYGLTTAYGSTATADQSPVTGSTDTAVSTGIAGLIPGTTYHFRVVAQNIGGTTYGGDLTFTAATGVIPPTAITTAATAVAATTATLNGTVNANGISTTVTFQYGLTTAYGTTVTADQSPVTGSIDRAASKAISGLTNGVTYHYRVMATNAGGTTYGSDMTFTPGVTPPTATTNAASGVGTTTATLNGIVNANGTSTTVSFEYGLTTTYGTTVTAAQSPATGFSSTAVSSSLSALIPNTTYHFRVTGENTGGTTYGAGLTFTTLAPPTVTTHTASGMSTSGAILNGTVNANGTSTIVTFEYGLTTAYGTTVTATQSPVTGSASTAASRALTGLTSDTVYHYRAVGQNAQGTTYGADMTFVTSAPAAPAATTNAAVPVTADGATLNGTVNANNAMTTVTFEYGLTTAYGQSVSAAQNPVFGTTNTPVSATIGELQPNTTYHFRVSAQNANGTVYGTDMTFDTPFFPPAVLTISATGIGVDSATLNGFVYPRGADTTVTFEYGTDTGYGTTVDADQSPLTTNLNIAQPVSKSISGLANNTTYHYRVVAVNAGGTTYGNDMTFTIGTVGTAPTATTTAATGVGSNTATLTGTVNAGDSATIVTFEYGLDTGYGSVAIASQSPVTGTTDTSVSAAVSELLPNTTYHYRVTATNANGTANGADMTFTTLPQAPTATTTAATAVAATTATLSGTVNANGTSTTVTFQYGLTTAYGTTVTADQSPVTGTTNTAASKAITGLTNGLTYHYRVAATNAGGTTYGSDMTFTPGVTPPTATTNAASGVGTTAATLNGIVNANGTSTTVTFEYGPTTAYGKTAIAVPGTVTGFSNTAVSASLSALIPNTTYHFRVVGVNTGGTAHGADMSFTTLAPPTVTTTAASGVSTSGATLNGTVNANGNSTTATFQYGLTTAYGTTVTADQSPVIGSTAVSKAITGLTSDTVYHYRAVGQNAQGTTYGADMTFVTTLSAPTVTTNAATSVLYNGATLNGTVSSNNSSTTVTFEYGLTVAYGTTVTAAQSPVTGVNVAVSKAITGLSNNQTYHYRVVGQNANGTTNGADMTLTTSLAPTAITQAATGAGASFATLNGLVNANNSGTNITFEYGLTTAYGTTASGVPGFISDNIDTPASAALTGLLNNTLYHYRVKANNIFGTTNGADMTFTTTTSPTAVTNAATAVGSVTVTLNGTVNASGAGTTVTFEYGETTGYGRVTTAAQSPVTGSSDTSVNSSLDSLIPNTTYHYRVIAQNINDTACGADMTFTTTELPPTTVTNTATGVSGTGATLNGMVNANNNSTTVTFQYGLTIAYGTTVTADQSPVTGFINTAVSKAITGLTTNTTYHYRVVAQNGSGTTHGADMTFFTGIAPPAATTGGATNIGPDSATLHGTVNAYNASATVTFEFGETTSYGRTVTAGPSPVNGSADTAVSADIDALNANTVYHYRVCAENSAGTTCGADMTFTTNPTGTPTVVTADPTDIAAMYATGGGNVTDEGDAPVTARGTCWSTLPNPTIVDSITSDGIGPGAFPSSITGLNPLTTYYERAYATNGAGTAYGNEVSFSTSAVIPTLSEWGMMIFALLIAVTAIVFIRKRKDSTA